MLSPHLSILAKIETGLFIPQKLIRDLYAVLN